MNIKHKQSRLVAVATLLLSAAALAAPTVSTASSTVKVRPTVAVPADLPVDLIAAKNEFVSFQVVIKADGAPVTNVSASFPGLTGAGQIASTDITLYRQGYLNLTKMSFPTAPPGLYPDALIPDIDETFREKRNAFPFTVPANEARAIWVDILVPKTAAPGTYNGTVTLTADGGFTKTVPVALNVVNTELPSTSSLPSAFLFQWNMACNVHTGNSECNGEGGPAGSYVLRDKYVRLGLEHRISLSNTMVYPFSGDWATFDQRYTPWLNGTVQTRLPGAALTATQYMGKRDAGQYAAYEAHMTAKGWLAKAYDYTGDEPPWGITFSEAKSRAQLVKQAAPNLRALLTTTIQAADEHGITPFLDLIVPVINHIDGVGNEFPGDQRPAYDPFLADPKNGLWIYQSCMSHGCAFGTNAAGNSAGAGWPSYMVDASAARNRAMQWQIFAQRGGGELYYETGLALDTAWNNVFRFNGNGDGTLFYPGLPSRIGGTTDIALPSIRLKQVRQGMQDYEWLKKVADAGDPAFAMQVAKALIPNAHSVGDDGAAFDAARKQLISRWLDLQPKPVEPTPPVAQPSVPAEPTQPAEPAAPTAPTAPELPNPVAETPPYEAPIEDPNAPGSDVLLPGEEGPVEGKTGCSSAGPVVPGIAVAALAVAALLRRRRMAVVSVRLRR